ncbi:MAG: ABC transporter substrate-binding protein, partial [Beijerinckiaceae bacterium]
MQRRTILKGLLATFFGSWAMRAARAEDIIKIGLILPMTGPSASTGRQISAGAKLYFAEHGAKVAGKSVELIIKDDTGVADITKRIAQELV